MCIIMNSCEYGNRWQLSQWQKFIADYVKTIQAYEKHGRELQTPQPDKINCQ